METKKLQTNEKKYCCEFCCFYTIRQSQYKKHLLTTKHIKNSNGNINSTNNNKTYICQCNKVYKSRSGFWKHKITCNKNVSKIENQINNTEKNIKISGELNEIQNVDYKSLFYEMVKENKEFKKIIINQQNQLFEHMKKQDEHLKKQDEHLKKQDEYFKKQDETIKDLIPKLGNNNITNNKNKFNINIFLNEQCKNAINMQEFIESIQVSMKDLNYTKENGLANGLSNIFIGNLNKLPIYERPIHCTDTKRETLYIKQNDKWDKDVSREKILQALKDLSSKQLKTFGNWINNHDLINNNGDKEKYLEILQIVTKSIKNVDAKIIKNICNNSYIKELLQEVQMKKVNIN